MVDRFDLLVIIGLVLIVAAVYLAAGWPGLLGLVGGVLVIAGWWGAGRGGDSA